jgi:hypothetical protein
MSPAIISLIIQLISGAAGGNVVGALLKKLPVDKILATVLGAIGGAGGAQLAQLIPAIQELLANAGYGADAGVGAGAGALLTLIVGLIKKAMAGPSAAA